MSTFSKVAILFSALALPSSATLNTADHDKDPVIATQSNYDIEAINARALAMAEKYKKASSVSPLAQMNLSDSSVEAALRNPEILTTKDFGAYINIYSVKP